MKKLKKYNFGKKNKENKIPSFIPPSMLNLFTKKTAYIPTLKIQPQVSFNL